MIDKEFDELEKAIMEHGYVPWSPRDGNEERFLVARSSLTMLLERIEKDRAIKEVTFLAYPKEHGPWPDSIEHYDIVTYYQIYVKRK